MILVFNLRNYISKSNLNEIRKKKIIKIRTESKQIEHKTKRWSKN